MMNRKTIETDQAPAAIGPYSQAVAVNGMLYVSGQIPLDPSTGEIVDGGLSVQTTRVLENLKAVIEAGGSSMTDVVKVTIYLTDMSEFATVNEIYGSYFSAPFPARACVEVSSPAKRSRGRNGCHCAIRLNGKCLPNCFCDLWAEPVFPHNEGELSLVLRIFDYLTVNDPSVDP